MKKPVVAALLTAAALATLAVPAGAAVPNRPASVTIACNDGSGKSAEVWRRAGQLAAKNPCLTQWLVMPYGQGYANGAFDNALELAPGAHFNWNKKQTATYLRGNLPRDEVLADEICNGISEGDPTLVYSYKDVRPGNC